MLNIFAKKEEKNILVADFIYKYVSSTKSLADGNKRKCRNWANHLKIFEQETGIQVFTDTFKEPVAVEFVYHLRKRGLKSNTVKSIFEGVGTFVRRAQRRGYKANLSFEFVKVAKEETPAVYLTWAEIRRLNGLKNISKEAKAVRDLFLVGCLTALRYSDFSALTSQNIVRNNIEGRAKKTKTNFVIPIHPIVRDVLDRNKGEFPKPKSQQAFNLMLKRLCKRAKINDPIRVEQTIGLKPVCKNLKKWELVSSHTARRTGATLMYLSGIPPARIMLITGHKSEQMFFQYVKIERRENAKTLSEYPFFQTQ